MLLLTLTLFTSSFGPVEAYDRTLWRTYTNMNFVTALAEGENEVYVGTTGGVRRYGRFRETWLPSLTTADGLPDNLVERLAFEPHTGDLHIQTRNGGARWLSRLETVTVGGGVTERYRSLPRIPPSVVLPFGYFVQGNLIRGPRRDYRITEILIDTWDILWVGTAGLGVGRADLRFDTLEFLRSGPLEQNVTAMVRDGHHLWFGGQDDFGTFPRGISRYDLSQDQWDYFEENVVYGLDNAQVTAIHADGENVWFGTDRGLMRYKRDNDTWTTYQFSRWTHRPIGRTSTLARDGNRVWIGTTTGLAVLDVPVDTLRTVAGSERFEIEDLAVGNQHVWAATDRGLFHCDRKVVTWAPSGLATGPVRAVETHGDTLVVVLAEPPSVARYAHIDSPAVTWPLPEAGGSRQISTAVDGPRIWVGTDQGVLLLQTDRDDWRHLTSADGLVDDDVRAVVIDGGSAWFGTRHGASRYQWSEDFANQSEDPEKN